MKHADFTIGTEFETCTGQRWRCTDVGQRSITAIELRRDLDEAWFCGPPYAVPEVVFDELEIASAYRSIEEVTLSGLDDVGRGLYLRYSSQAVETMMKARGLEGSRRYPHPRLLRVERVDAAGEIQQPYAAEPTGDGWRILLYAPCTETFSALPEAEFVRLQPATQEDLEARMRATR